LNNCIYCTKGFIPNEKSNIIIEEETKCIKCPEGTYNKRDGSIKCKKCPEFTMSSKKFDRLMNFYNRCILDNIIHNKAYLRRYNTFVLDQRQKLLCEYDNYSCINDFIGKKLKFNENERINIYLSPKRASTLKLSDPFGNNIYSNNIGHVFAYDNNQTINNLGKKINFVKIVEGTDKKGLLIKYTDGDVCVENPKIRYSTYLFIKCNKINEKVFSQYYRRIYLISPIDNCSLIIEWETKVGCMNCVYNRIESEKVIYER
jgi:hypothetical protein